MRAGSYRMMESDRQKYSEESQNIIKRQRQAIEKIKKENERLKEQLATESQTGPGQSENSSLSQIALLQENCDQFQRKIELERRRLEELEKHSKIYQVRLL
jgi:hypothetical protein